MVWTLCVYQKGVSFDNRGKREKIAVLAEAENNLAVDIELAHIDYMEEDLDHKAVDTSDSLVVVIVHPIGWVEDERQDLHSIVVGNCPVEHSGTNCFGFDRTIVC
jgi:hypothetical protein